MATDIKWEAPTVGLTSLLTTSLNSLASDTTDDGGAAAINNESTLTTYMDLELTLASVDLSAQSNPSVWVYLVESIDGGTDFDTYTDATADEDLFPPFDKVCAIMSVRNGNGAEAKTAIKSMIPIPPGRFKLVVHNKCGASLAASGNVLAYRTYNLNNV